MLFLELVLGIFALLIFVLMLTQVVMPFLLNTPFFPMFRKVTLQLIAVEEAELELEEKTELYQLQKRMFALNQEITALEQKIVETSTSKS